jgi:hypothetical protein
VTADHHVARCGGEEVIMPGPEPKHASVRARRNKTATRATLSKPNAAEAVPAPELPPIVDPETGEAVLWSPMTLRWWEDLWASPMAPEYDDSDVHGLYVLASLVNAFWRAPSSALAAEIRLQRQCFGLTPMDRRRLQWEIERTDEAQAKGAKRRAATAPTQPATRRAKDDPRNFLKAV